MEEKNEISLPDQLFDFVSNCGLGRLRWFIVSEVDFPKEYVEMIQKHIYVPRIQYPETFYMMCTKRKINGQVTNIYGIGQSSPMKSYKILDYSKAYEYLQSRINYYQRDKIDFFWSAQLEPDDSGQNEFWNDFHSKMNKAIEEKKKKFDEDFEKYETSLEENDKNYLMISIFCGIIVLVIIIVTVVLLKKRKK